MEESAGIGTKPPMMSRTVRFNGENAGYLDGGEGPAVLYFHGTGAGNDLAAVMEQDLIDAGFRLVIPNRPGYLETSLACGRRSEDAAKIGAAVLDDLRVDRAIVIGTSGGGLPAIRFASLFPDRTSALILQCAQSHRWDAPEWLPQGKGWILRFVNRPLWKRMIHKAHHLQTRFFRWMKNSYLKAMSGIRYDELRGDPVAIRLRDVMIEHSIACIKQPAGIENDLDALLDEPVLSDNVVQCPTLIIHDEADPVVPFRHAEWSHNLIPHAELLNLQLGGHLIWLGRDAGQMFERRREFIRECGSQ